MDHFIESLNGAQKKAVTNCEGPALVIAGAGSGKTRVLTYRIAYLLEQKVEPSKILALTFTNKAANSMKERIAEIVGTDSARFIRMGTFHSVFAKILRRESHRLGYTEKFTIYDATDTKSLLKRIIREMYLDEKVYNPAIVYSRISYAKNNLITANAYISNPKIVNQDRIFKREKLGEVYAEYAKRCKRADAMDFDDLLLNTNILFRDFPEVLANYQNNYQYILVDEYQDTNYSQYLIVKKLAEKHRNLAVVGDDAQSIYSFRGAQIENILNFQKDYPECKVYKLEQNYRSTKNIVEAANSVIANNKNQLHKKSFSANESGTNIRVFRSRTDGEESYCIAREIQTFVNQGNKFNENAVLYRTNAQSRVLEQAFKNMDIPYRIYGSLSFYDRKEIKDVLAYFRLIINEKDDEAFRRVINYPARGIGTTTLTKIEQAAMTGETNLWEIAAGTIEGKYELALNAGTVEKIRRFLEVVQSLKEQQDKIDAYEMAMFVVEKTGVMHDLDPAKTMENIARYENVEELLNSIKESVEKYGSSENPFKLEDYLEEVALLTNEEEDKEDHNKVAMMTIHAAKGLEFENVFVTGIEENLFPSVRSAEKPDELEEERRLFYVALTRAMKNISLSFSLTRMKWGDMQHCRPSRFIEEIDQTYLDYQFDQEQAESQNVSSGNHFKNRPNAYRGTTKTEDFQPIPTRPKNLKKMKDAVGTSFNKNAQASGQSMQEEIRPGMRVKHERFGEGKVLRVEGVMPDTKAIVFFDTQGEKMLLLRFAKLNVLQSH